MGSVSLVGVPHEESDLVALRLDILKHRNLAVRDGIRKDPALRARIADLLAQ
jgi:hypothetical protein